jgi:hypothetical protein
VERASRGQQHAPALAFLRLDPDLTDGVHAYQLCDAPRVVTVILIPEARLLQRRSSQVEPGRIDQQDEDLRRPMR